MKESLRIRDPYGSLIFILPMVGFEPTSDPSLKDRSIQLSYIGSMRKIEDLVITNALNIKPVDTYLPTRYITSLPNSLKLSDL